MKKLVKILVLAFILASLPLTIFLVSKRQEIRKKAASCPAASYITVTNLSGPSFNSNRLQAHVYISGSVDAADIVLEYDPAKISTRSIIKKNIGGLVHRDGSGSETGSATTKAVLFMIKRPIEADAGAHGEIAVVNFEIITNQTTTTNITYGAKTTIAHMGSAGGADCGANITINLNERPKKEVRINSGGDKYIDKESKVWEKDFGYTGGRTYKTTHDILETSDPDLYKTERFGMTSYKFDIPNGSYQVTLKFAEIFDGCQKVNCRIFDIKIEGTKVLSSFDIFAQAGGGYKAVDKTFNATVSDGQLNINFVPRKNNPSINAISLTGQ